MNPQLTSQPRTTQIPCAFCEGTGNDPFQIMSALSRCCVCGGRGVNTILAPGMRCAHCQGRGSVKTLTCTVCRGRGVVRALEGPTALCPECVGTGDDALAPALECLNCHGRGVVLVEG